MTRVEPKRIPCALAPQDYMLASPRGDGKYLFIANWAGYAGRRVIIALDRAAAKALKKELKAFLRGDL